MDIFDQIEQERKGLATEKVQKQDIFDQLLREQSKGGAIGRAAKGAISGLGTYGDILDIIGVQSKEQMLPGQKAIFEAEQRVPEHMKPYFTEEEPTYGRLPSSEEANRFAELLGLPKEKGLTFAERAIERGAKGITGAALLGGTPTALLGGIPTALGLAGAGGIAGQAAEEITGSPVAGAITEFATGLAPGKKILTQAKKPSGMPKYRFENVKKPTYVSSKIIDKIDTNVENQFKKQAKTLLSDAPITKQRSQFKDFKNHLSKSFQKVDEMAKDIPNKIDIGEMRKDISDIANKKVKPGLSHSDFEKEYLKNMDTIIKDIDPKKNSFYESVKQYRKNNDSLTEYFDPSKPPSMNRAKAEALLDYNNSIVNLYEKELPGSEFTKLFKSTNKQWSDLLALEDVEDVLKNMFDKGLNFKVAEKAIGSENFNRSLNKLIGKKGSENFLKLMDEFVSIKEARSMLKEAKSHGIAGTTAHALGYLVHPGISGSYLTKQAFQHLYHRSLAKPEIFVDWRKGLELAKKGDLQGAFANFKKIDKKTKKH